MTSPTTEQVSSGLITGGGPDELSDPFDLDIRFIEGTPAAETMLLCSTSDNCGSSCPSACSGSAY